MTRITGVLALGWFARHGHLLHLRRPIHGGGHRTGGLVSLQVHPWQHCAAVCRLLGAYEIQGMLHYAETAHARARAVQCGRFSRFAEPGFNCIWCCVGAGPGLHQCSQTPNCLPLNEGDSCAFLRQAPEACFPLHKALCLAGEAVAGSLSLRIQQLDVRCETKTLDNVRALSPVCVVHKRLEAGC